MGGFLWEELSLVFSRTPCGFPLVWAHVGYAKLFPRSTGSFLESFDMLETRRMGPHWVSGSSGGQVMRPDCMGCRGELWAPCSGGGCETGYGWAWSHPSMCVYVCLGADTLSASPGPEVAGG